MNLCASDQHYDPANYNMTLNNPLGPGYSGESDQVVSTSQAEHPHPMNHGQVMYSNSGQAQHTRHAMNHCQVMYSDSGQAQHPQQAMNHGQIMNPSQVVYPGQVKYHGQTMNPAPVLNPCQVMSYSEAMEPVFHPVPMTATRQESSMRITNQSRFVNARNQLSHQKYSISNKVITDLNNTKKRKRDNVAQMMMLS